MTRQAGRSVGSSAGPEERLARALATLVAHGGGPAALGAACAAGLSRLDGAGVTLVARDGAPERLCASDEVVSRLEEFQLVMGEGPGVDAAARGGPVLTPDLSAPEARRRCSPSRCGWARSGSVW